MIYIGKPHRLTYVQTRKQLMLERLRWLTVSDFLYDASSSQTKSYYDGLVKLGYARPKEVDGQRLIEITAFGRYAANAMCLR